MSKIEWTGETWNPLIGCDKISAGCKNCYAIRTAWIRMHNPMMAERYAGTVEKTANGSLNWTGKVNQVESVLLKPFHKKKPTIYFVNSMSDLFHEDVPFEFIDKIFAIMALSPQHTFQVLTKRAARMKEYFSDQRKAIIWQHARVISQRMGMDHYSMHFPWPLPNVWLGVSVEDQTTANMRIPTLLQVPASIRFLSCEPLLGEVDLTEVMLPREYGVFPEEKYINCLTSEDDDHFYNKHNKIDWVIVGGESGPEARPMHAAWVRKIQRACQQDGVFFFFKQWGEYRPANEMDY